MPVVLTDLMTPTAARVLRDAAASLPFADGKDTVAGNARRVKVNEQAVTGADTGAIITKVKSLLADHPVFQALAIPRHFAQLIVSRTQTGGHYGDHVDNALINGQRTDLSFTLFLSDPKSYEGGALVIGDRVEDRCFKPDQGEAVLYPSNTLHRVEPVTSGTRIAVIGWVTSWVRDPAQREVLFDLWQTTKAAQDPEQLRLLSKSRTNLIRMWAG